MSTESPERSELVETLKKAGDAASGGPVYRLIIVGMLALLGLLLGLGVAFYLEVQHRNTVEERTDRQANAARVELIRIASRLEECTTPPEKRGSLPGSSDCYTEGQVRGQELVLQLICSNYELHGQSPPPKVICPIRSG